MAPPPKVSGPVRPNTSNMPKVGPALIPSLLNAYLDPADEDHDGNSRVVGDLVEGEVVEVWKDIRVGKQRVELVVDRRRTIDAEDDAADGDQDDDDVEDVPEAFEVRQTNLLDLQSTNYIHQICHIHLNHLAFCLFVFCCV